MNYNRKYANLVWSSSVYEKRKYLLIVVGLFLHCVQICHCYWFNKEMNEWPIAKQEDVQVRLSGREKKLWVDNGAGLLGRDSEEAGGAKMTER